MKILATNKNIQDIPESVLRSQANVLARVSVFIVSNKEDHVDKNNLLELLSVFIENLKNTSR